MKALVCKTPGALEYIEVQMPALKKEHSILKINSVGICGTDYHAFDGTQPYFEYPRILGHEISAEIADTEPDSGFVIGEKVTVSPYFYCGKCIACRSHKTNCCEQLQVLGVHTDGAMCSYILVPDYSIISGNKLREDELVLVEPLAIGAHGISRAQIKQGEFILVMGAGPIGIATMNFAIIAGAKVIAMDKNQKRLDFCKNKLGIPYTINPDEDDIIEKLREFTNKDMPTVILDCTGNIKAINNAVNYLAHGGRFVIIGLQKEEISINHPGFHKKEATLMSSRNALPEDFKHVISCIQNGKIKTKDYITHRLKFGDPNLSFTNQDQTLIKAILVLDDEI
ncbi:zinc-binding alcohol dehydrogenase family protein [Pedobacter frigoris]|uniref:zinc-binding alcohol dehydrogenase family protein n=1 Tax=Pedobacter frigoris TaxID=2571272 RepID=UPI00293196D7|nr:zinc-binding alcohol dehydrogenase family protein [Pedobacter frigoris]